ncbi:MAG: TetR/AcrR family transcriptional regulator [Clostridiaceae bacterium]
MNVYEAFEKLSDAKKEKIIKSSMEVFAEKGYVNASTNDIIKKAGISKGILFHYFGNKKNLYLYVLDRTLEIAVGKISTGNGTASSDLFERISATGMMKLRLALEEPLIYRMIFTTFINTPDPIKEAVQDRYKKLYGFAMKMFFDGLDLSKIRSGVDPNKAIEVILLFLEGYQAKYIEAWKNISADEALASMDKLMEESGVYFDILKKGIYSNS